MYLFLFQASVLHMSSLFHAFILCQVWTMYCESYAALNSPQSETYTLAHTTIMDFWARATPGVLQLLSTSKVVSVWLLSVVWLSPSPCISTLNVTTNYGVNAKLCQQMAEMVNLHFLGLLEALQECNSAVLSKVRNSHIGIGTLFSIVFLYLFI